MFDPRVKRKAPEREAALQQNWEADIHTVELERCDRTEDPLGYKVVFYTGEQIRAAAKTYVIGASHLVKRLASLRRAGYEAPMTQHAIKMLEKHLGTEYFTA